MKFGKTAIAALVMSALLATLSGCQQEGPTEKAGKEVDKAMEKVGQQMEKAGETIQDATKGDKR
jgi:predicted small lipoprotein YifL